MLEWLTELRKTPLLTRLPIHYNGYQRAQINSQVKGEEAEVRERERLSAWSLVPPHGSSKKGQ